MSDPTNENIIIKPEPGVEQTDVELPLNEKYKDEATRIEDENTSNPSYYQTKTLKIQSFNIKRFSEIDYVNNLDSITDHIQSTVSDDVDGIKFKSGGKEFVVSIFHADSKHDAKKIGEGGFGEVFRTGAISSIDKSMTKQFAIKKISSPNRASAREIAYNEFMTNKQISQTDNINEKFAYYGCILRKNAYYIIMDVFDGSLSDIIQRCRVNNLMMFINEDVLKYVWFNIFKNLGILLESVSE